MYELNELIETFKKHSIECEKRDRVMIENWLKEYPGEPLPDYLEDRVKGKLFDINLALEAICKEIEKLKIELGGWK